MNNKLPVSDKILKILLKDRTTGKNILWATDNYRKYGAAYYEDMPINEELLFVNDESIIKPRSEKSKAEQQRRVRQKAEVFTPSWVCNMMNNHIFTDWFANENAFNTENEKEKRWETNYNPIVFADGKDWQEYVNLNVLEITCGEAPFLVSRYDTVTGDTIAVPDRIGLLDRKLRIVREKINTSDDWLTWATTSLQSTYGYEWQGDNILLARINMLLTMQEHYQYQFNKECPADRIEAWAMIISWNIWQMDGLKFVIPNSCHREKPKQKELLLFEGIYETDEKETECEGCKKGDYFKHNGIYCLVKDWKKNKIERFVDSMQKNGEE